MVSRCHDEDGRCQLPVVCFIISRVRLSIPHSLHLYLVSPQDRLRASGVLPHDGVIVSCESGERKPESASENNLNSEDNPFYHPQTNSRRMCRVSTQCSVTF